MGKSWCGGSLSRWKLKEVNSVGVKNDTLKENKEFDVRIKRKNFIGRKISSKYAESLSTLINSVCFVKFS